MNFKIYYKVKILYNNLESKEVEYDMTGKEPLTFQINDTIETNFINDNSWYKLKINDVIINTEYYDSSKTMIYNVSIITKENCSN